MRRFGAWILALALQPPLVAIAKPPPSDLADLVGQAVGIDRVIVKARISEAVPTVKLGSRADVRRGEAVIVIGNPLC